MKQSTLISLKTKSALIIAATLWASAFAGIRAGLQGYSPGGLALLRFLIASLCMAIVYFRLPNKQPMPIKDKILLMLIGVVGLGCYHLALNYGEISIPSGVASFIISQSPVITMFFAVIFLRESYSLPVLFGMFVSMSGVILITLSGIQQFDFQAGVFYVFLAAIFGSSYSVLQKPFLKRYDAIEITTYVIWGGTLLLLLYLPGLQGEVTHASAQATLSVIYLGIFPAAIAYVAWSYALKEIPVARAVSFLYFMPIIATFFGWVWLHEVPTLLSLIGGLIALLGVWLVNQAYARNELKEAPV